MTDIYKSLNPIISWSTRTFSFRVAVRYLSNVAYAGRVTAISLLITFTVIITIFVQIILPGSFRSLYDYEEDSAVSLLTFLFAKSTK